MRLSIKDRAFGHSPFSNNPSPPVTFAPTPEPETPSQTPTRSRPTKKPTVQKSPTAPLTTRPTPMPTFDPTGQPTPLFTPNCTSSARACSTRGRTACGKLGCFYCRNKRKCVEEVGCC